jgi:hypothetical protein
MPKPFIFGEVPLFPHSDFATIHFLHIDIFPHPPIPWQGYPSKLSDAGTFSFHFTPASTYEIIILKSAVEGVRSKRLLAVSLLLSREEFSKKPDCSSRFDGGKTMDGKKDAFFGKIGKHYDLELTVDGVFDWDQGCYLGAHDQVGRRMLIRVTEQEEPLAIEENDSIFFRGQVLSHSKFFEIMLTFVKTTSNIIKP